MLIGALVGALTLWLALRGTDYPALWLNVAGARPAWILAALASVAVTVAAGVVRWRVLLEPVSAWRPLVHGVIIGQMLNIVFPIRLGEVARAYIVSRAESVPAARVLTTIAVEKLADLVAVGLTASLLLAFATLPGWVYGPARALVLTGVLAAAAVIVGLRPGVVGWITRMARRLAPTSWRPRLERQVAAAASACAGLHSRTRSVEFWLLSIGILLLAASTNYLLFIAFDLRLSAITALTLILALQAGTTLVSVPGNLGVFHYVIILVLTAHGVDRTTALGYAMVLYAVAILPKIAVGGILLAVDYRWVIDRGGEQAWTSDSVPLKAAAVSRVSVVIPCRNESEFIERLLDAVRAQDRPPDEIVVADNGSTDDSVDVVHAYARRHPEIPLHVVHCDDAGAAAAMNTGIKAAAGDVIVRLDGHSTPNREYIARALRHLDEPRAGVVGGVWEIASGGHTLRSQAIALAVGSALGSGGADYRHADRTQIRDVDTVPFGCYRRELWRTLNGYDPSLLVVEDGEFNYRVRRSGLRVILDPAIRSIYYPRRRMRTLARQYFRYGWWKMPFLLRHPGAVRIRQLIPLGFVAACVTLGFAGAWLPVAWMALLALLVLYSAAIFSVGLRAAGRARDLRLGPLVAAAFAVVHFSWGTGALLCLASFGWVPPWRLHPRGTRV